jgi:mRNA interferase RelE/StbE
LTFTIEVTASARRALTRDLPETAAAACWEFITGPLAANPYRVGKPLRGRLDGLYAARRGEFRVVYEIFDERVVVRVINIDHRRDIYR